MSSLLVQIVEDFIISPQILFFKFYTKTKMFFIWYAKLTVSLRLQKFNISNAIYLCCLCCFKLRKTFLSLSWLFFLIFISLGTALRWFYYSPSVLYYEMFTLAKLSLIMPAISSRFLTCLGHLGQHETERIFSIYNASTVVIVAWLLCVAVTDGFTNKLCRCKQSITLKGKSIQP